MIELRWRKAEGVTHFHSAQVGMGPATAVETCGELNAVKNSRGEWMVLQYRQIESVDMKDPMPIDAAAVPAQIWADWEDVPVEKV